jgi:hypothetical protein
MTLWLAYREQLRLREWQEFSNALKDYEDLLNEHYYGDNCMCLVCSPDTDSCPVCGDMRVDGVCSWENYSDRSLMQAMDIDAAGGGVAWVEYVLTHHHEDWVTEMGRQSECAIPRPGHGLVYPEGV